MATTHQAASQAARDGPSPPAVLPLVDVRVCARVGADGCFAQLAHVKSNVLTQTVFPRPCLPHLLCLLQVSCCSLLSFGRGRAGAGVARLLPSQYPRLEGSPLFGKEPKPCVTWRAMMSYLSFVFKVHTFLGSEHREALEPGGLS